MENIKYGRPNTYIMLSEDEVAEVKCDSSRTTGGGTLHSLAVFSFPLSEDVNNALLKIKSEMINEMRNKSSSL